jgi:hypothetical protein
MHLSLVFKSVLWSAAASGDGDPSLSNRYLTGATLHVHGGGPRSHEEVDVEVNDSLQFSEQTAI